MALRALFAAALLVMGPAFSAAAQESVPAKANGAVRFATFNTALNAREAGGIVARLEDGSDPQAMKVVEVIQRVRPDVLVLQELDRDADGRALALFADLLATAQNGAAPIAYPYSVFPPSNTGVPSGVDLDGDGVVGGPNDAKGYGAHPGQYAFAVLSMFPLGPARTFANFLWADVPGGRMPRGFYSPEAAAVLPLSSKTHIIVPVDTAGGTIAVLAAHPTPPVFDDGTGGPGRIGADEPVDWNGRRNADEIRLLADLLDVRTSGWAVDDTGVAGGLPVGAHAVVLGDLNADPAKGDARPGAIVRLLDDGRINPVTPLGADGSADTARFNGGMRVDYALPTAGLEVTGSGVARRLPDDPLSRLDDASDHFLVWVDVRAP